MILIKSDHFEIYDSIILNEIEENNDLNLNQISSKLKCSKSIIVSRIDDLINKGYIKISENNFVLTIMGKSKKLSNEIFLYKNRDNQKLSNKSMYDWKRIYIPSKDIFD